MPKNKNSEVEYVLWDGMYCPKCSKGEVFRMIDYEATGVVGHATCLGCGHKFIEEYMLVSSGPDLKRFTDDTTRVFFRPGQDKHWRTAFILDKDAAGSVDVVDGEGNLLFRLDMSYTPGQPSGVVVVVKPEDDAKLGFVAVGERPDITPGSIQVMLKEN